MLFRSATNFNYWSVFRTQGYDDIGNAIILPMPNDTNNYFLLHKNNIAYYEKIMSVIKPGVTKILWDEYFRNKSSENSNNQKKKGLQILSPPKDPGKDCNPLPVN